MIGELEWMCLCRVGAWKGRRVMGARRLYMEIEWNLCELSAMIADKMVHSRSKDVKKKEGIRIMGAIKWK